MESIETSFEPNPVKYTKDMFSEISYNKNLYSNDEPYSSSNVGRISPYTAASPGIHHTFDKTATPIIQQRRRTAIPRDATLPTPETKPDTLPTKSVFAAEAKNHDAPASNHAEAAATMASNVSGTKANPNQNAPLANPHRHQPKPPHRAKKSPSPPQNMEPTLKSAVHARAASTVKQSAPAIVQHAATATNVGSTVPTMSPRARRGPTISSANCEKRRVGHMFLGWFWQ
jgi:hypothetical protein